MEKRIEKDEANNPIIELATYCIRLTEGFMTCKRRWNMKDWRKERGSISSSKQKSFRGKNILMVSYYQKKNWPSFLSYSRKLYESIS